MHEWEGGALDTLVVKDNYSVREKYFLEHHPKIYEYYDPVS